MGDQVAFGMVEEGGQVIARIGGHPFHGVELTGERVPVAEVRLVAPMLPSKIIAIGKNYADHAREMGGEPRRSRSCSSSPARP
ncbi:hypothetical protein GCM10027612_77400 [Microbispora bryophytorum subsp. camponoti]